MLNLFTNLVSYW